jgi:hypothetical protein
MWQSLFTDMFNSLNQPSFSVPETVVLGIHLFNISKGLECTGLQEDDEVSSDLLPHNWNHNPQLYSFRYAFKSISIHQKLLKLGQTKLSIHTVRSDQSSKVFQHTIETSELEADLNSDNFIQALTTKILLPYEEQIIKKLELTESAKKVENKQNEGKKRSSLQDDAPFGIPHGAGGFGVPYGGGYGGPFGGVPSNPYANPFGVGNRVGPNHPMFANPPGSRWEPPDPFFMPQNPDHFMPPGPQGPFQPFGRGGFGGPPGYF